LAAGGIGTVLGMARRGFDGRGSDSFQIACSGS
jgi:hypothetical protein